MLFVSLAYGVFMLRGLVVFVGPLVGGVLPSEIGEHLGTLLVLVGLLVFFVALAQR